MVRATVALGSAALLAGCAGSHTPAPPAGRVLARLAPVTALAVRTDGTLLAGVQSGRIVSIARDGRARPLAQLAVSSARGQRGLLGLTTSGDRVFAGWTTPTGRIVVGELRGDGTRRVWSGPQSATLANGGRVAFRGDRLLVSIGDLQSEPRSGRILALDPDAPSTQTPATLSTGWNNPFAFTTLPNGELWVADNSPGRAPERLARGDEGAPTTVTSLPVKTAPSGVAAIDDRTLAVCGFVSGTLDRYVRAGTRWRRAGVIARGCRYGVVRRGHALIFATDHDLREVQI